MKENKAVKPKREKFVTRSMSERISYMKSQILKQLLFLGVLFTGQIYLYTRHEGVEGSPCDNLRGPIGWANFILVFKIILALSVYFTVDVDPEDRTP